MAPLSASLTLLIILSAISSGCGQSHGNESPYTSQTPITIEVINSLNNAPKRIYSTYVVFRGILIGAMRRLQETNKHFTFTYSEDKNYGPFLQSVNGLAGDFSQRTYWQLKVKKVDGTEIIPDVGIGCYIPSANDVIIFNYTSW